MTRVITLTATLIIAVLALASLATADVPQMINYQGQLTNSSGDPLDTTVSITFTIYDAATNGSSKWTETHSSVTVVDGLFNVILGAGTPPVPIDDTVFNQPDRWLGITVGADPELTPRTQLVSVPYALHASGTGWVDDGTVVRLDTETDLVGIGTNTPQGKLHVYSNTGDEAIYAMSVSGGTGIAGYFQGGEKGVQAYVGSGSGYKFGVYGQTAGSDDLIGYGVYGVSNFGNGCIGVGGSASAGAGSSIGVAGRADGTGGTDHTGVDGYAIHAEVTNIGVKGTANGSAITNYGFKSEAFGPATTNYGIYAEASGGTTNYAGYFDGNVHITGTLTGGGGNWSVTDSVLYTNNYWGIARGGADNALLGSAAHTIVNLGVACTTGTVGSGQTVSGGYRNIVKVPYGTVGGGEGNTVIESYGTVGGGIDNTADYKCTVGGGDENAATETKSTVGGGNSNTASNSYATVAGGTSNLASGDGSTIGGGDDNEASGYRSTVSGGANNRALSDYTWIGGGQNNTTKGLAAAVPGGVNNAAEGDYSYACGRGAKATHEGTFIWADASGEELVSTEPNQFVIRASGGTRVYSNADQSAGVTIHAGASAWAVNSDRNLKENFTPIDGKKLLEKIAALPISEWNYKTQSINVKHIGPVAQDFHAAFGLGDDDVTISTIDPAGVALAGIKELMNENRQLRVLIEGLEHRLQQLEAR